MNTTAISLNSSDHSWSRRCSTETILSIQGRETDFARDTSDTEPPSSDAEFEPVSEPEDDPPLFDDTSAESDNEIIRTEVIEVRVGSEGELLFADSERTDDTQSDSELDYYDYGACARCRAVNDSPFYRYCHKCFQARKSLFPPRPRRKHKRRAKTEDIISSQELPRALSQDSGVDTASQGTSQEDPPLDPPLKRRAATPPLYPHSKRAGSLDPKRAKYSDSEDEVVPLSKSISDPSVSIEQLNVSKKVIADTIKEIENKELCVVCVTEPKSGVFVHGRLAHICCCYKCAVKVWAKTKRCPICQRKISNVLRAVVM